MILTFNSGFGGGGEALPPTSCGNIQANAGDNKIFLTWTDPENLVLDGIVYAQWKGTKVVRKLGGYPKDENDGQIVVNNLTRNAYQTVPFEDAGLENGTEYYYGFFPYSPENIYNRSGAANIKVIPSAAITVGIRIDESILDPTEAITYTDDSDIKIAGSQAWDSYFGYYPCLLKDGKEVGKLNPNNFAQFENGQPADITSGNAGDVMIAYPRIGVKFERDGKVLTIHMTKDTTLPDYTYYAHSRGDASRDVFYLGAYEGAVENNVTYKLYSLAQKTPSKYDRLSSYLTYAHAIGAGYEITGFYQLTFIQVMFLLKYKTRNSQQALGYGYTRLDGVRNTGRTVDKGMNYGTLNETDEVKVFGLENLWGNIYEWMTGIYLTNTFIKTTTNNFNATGSGYKQQSSYTTFGKSSFYFKSVFGTNELGFITDGDGRGSNTEGYCDLGGVEYGPVRYGGCETIGSGIFYHYGKFENDSNSLTGARLMYL